MRWLLSHRFDPSGAAIADRHYNRRTHGSPQFSPPGRLVVLITPDASALWTTVWQEHVLHRWPGAWMCSTFRNEAPDRYRSSDLILEAVAATRHEFGEPPAPGLVTFVDPAKVRHKRDPGRCFLRAGFLRDGLTDGGLVALRLPPERMPPAEAPGDAQGDLLTGLPAMNTLAR